MAKKPCRIHYRRLNREVGAFPAVTLSDRIAAALNADSGDGTPIRAHVSHRVAQAPGQPDYQRALNNYEITDDWVFGTVCLYAPGQMQALLRLTGNEAQADAEAVQEAFEIAEQAAPAGHEYLYGLTYWIAIGDHFYQIQAIALQVGAMEQYLTWLLAERARAIPADSFVQLRAEFDRDQLAGEEPTFIQVGGIVPETIRAAEVVPEQQPGLEIVDVEEKEKIAGAALSWAKGREILDDLYGPVKAQELVDQVPPEASLEVSVNIGYRTKRRKLQRTFMKELEGGLRNLPDGEVTVRTKAGVSKGADARLFQDMSIAKVSDKSGLLDLIDARNQMLEVHRRFLHDGNIAP